MPEYYEITTKPFYKGMPINTGKYNNLSCRTDILASFETILNLMLARYSRIRAIHFVTRYSLGALPGAYDISIFSKSFKESLEYKFGPMVHYLWVKEQAESDNSHYHFVVFLNGHKTKSIVPVLDKAEKIWKRVIGFSPYEHGDKRLINWCVDSDHEYDYPNGVELNTNDPLFIHKRDAVFRRLSYLAKTSTKVKSGRGWSSSCRNK